MAKIPASIRNNNPGAMYPGKSSKRYGATKVNIIGGGHEIAEFPDAVKGAAAQFDLLRRVYAGKPLAAAITKWSGGNDPAAYLKVIGKRTGLQPEDTLSVDYLENPVTGIPFAKAMAAHEAGQEYPMSDAEWFKAHALVFPAKPKNGAGNWLDLARADLGVCEVAGKGDNPIIMQWYVDVGHPEVEHDETPNCAAFTGSKLKRAGMAYLETLAARDYQRYGEPLEEPEEGCIAVLWRDNPNSWKGHVGFVVGFTKTTIKLLAANQGDKVSVETFPRHQVLAFRRPVAANAPVVETVQASKSLQAIVLSWFAVLGAGLTNTADVVTGQAATLYTAVMQTGDAIEPVQSLALRLNLPFPVKLTLASMAVTLVIVFVRELKRKRAN